MHGATPYRQIGAVTLGGTVMPTNRCKAPAKTAARAKRIPAVQISMNLHRDVLGKTDRLMANTANAARSRPPADTEPPHPTNCHMGHRRAGLFLRGFRNRRRGPRVLVRVGNKRCQFSLILPWWVRCWLRCCSWRTRRWRSAARCRSTTNPSACRNASIQAADEEPHSYRDARARAGHDVGGGARRCSTRVSPRCPGVRAAAAAAAQAEAVPQRRSSPPKKANAVLRETAPGRRLARLRLVAERQRRLLWRRQFGFGRSSEIRLSRRAFDQPNKLIATPIKSPKRASIRATGSAMENSARA